MEVTALQQLENWILKYEKVNGTPTMCEIKSQIEMFKDLEKQQIIDAKHKGFECGCDLSRGNKAEFKSAEEYYEKTYGKAN